MISNGVDLIKNKVYILTSIGGIPMAEMTKYVIEYGSDGEGFTLSQAVWASNFELVTTHARNHIAFHQNTALGCDGARISEVKCEIDSMGEHLPLARDPSDIILG